MITQEPKISLVWAVNMSEDFIDNRSLTKHGLRIILGRVVLIQGKLIQRWSKHRIHTAGICQGAPTGQGRV